MSRNAARASTARHGRNEAGQNLDDTIVRRRLPGPAGLWLLRRDRDGQGATRSPGGWVCPDCRLAIQDAVAVRLGFCARCHDFTGMCSAGRKIVCPDMMTVTTWHMPCTRLGAAPWRIIQNGNPRNALLCLVHDAELRSGRASWIMQAFPLASPAGP
jgi:hypothetical protein